MIEVRDPYAGLVHELGHPHQLAELNLRYLVGVRMVIGMKTGREEDDRDALGSVAVMVATVIDLLRVGRLGNAVQAKAMTDLVT